MYTSENRRTISTAPQLSDYLARLIEFVAPRARIWSENSAYFILVTVLWGVVMSMALLTAAS